MAAENVHRYTSAFNIIIQNLVHRRNLYCEALHGIKGKVEAGVTSFRTFPSFRKHHRRASQSKLREAAWKWEVSTLVNPGVLYDFGGMVICQMSMLSGCVWLGFMSTKLPSVSADRACKYPI